MKVLGISNGGREHAMAKAIVADSRVTELCWTPENVGIGTFARSFSVTADDIAGLKLLAAELKPDLVVVGSEAPLELGLADDLKAMGIPVAAPTQAAAKLETSKIYTHELCLKLGVPIPDGTIGSTAEDAHKSVDLMGGELVVKKDGLAAGKGAIVCSTRTEAHAAVDEIMVEQKHGKENNAVLIQRRVGQSNSKEVSFFVAVNGTCYQPLTTAMDYKRAGDGNTGLNTGGMGALSPSPYWTPALQAEVCERIVEPVIMHLAYSGFPFQGILYVGLMIVNGRPILIEFNVRWGDPEAQASIPRLDTKRGPNLLDILQATACSEPTELGKLRLAWKDVKSVCLVMAGKGYPGTPKKGAVISNLHRAEAMGATIYHAGTKRSDGGTITINGGRALGIQALGDTFRAAQQTVYRAAAQIECPDLWYRKDIGDNLF